MEGSKKWRNRKEKVKWYYFRKKGKKRFRLNELKRDSNKFLEVGNLQKDLSRVSRDGVYWEDFRGDLRQSLKKDLNKGVDWRDFPKEGGTDRLENTGRSIDRSGLRSGSKREVKQFGLWEMSRGKGKGKRKEKWKGRVHPLGGMVGARVGVARRDEAYTRYIYKLWKVNWKFYNIWNRYRKRKRFRRFVRQRLRLVWEKFLEKKSCKRIIILSLRFTYRNCWVTLMRKTGGIIVAYSCGRALLGRGRYGERKLVGRSRRLSLPVLAEMAYLSVRKLKLLGFKKVYVVLRCFPVFMVEVFLRVLVDGGIRICGIFSRIPVAHNGCKVFNRRRV